MNIKLIDPQLRLNKFTEQIAENPVSLVLHNRDVADIDGFFDHDWSCV